MKRLALMLLLLFSGVVTAQEITKKYRLTIGDQSIVVELEEIKEPTPVPDPDPDPVPEPDPDPIPDPEPDPDPEPQLATNLQRLKDGGWKIPFTHLQEHPPVDEIKAAIIPPQQADENGVCTRRLWMKRNLSFESFDPVALRSILNSKGRGILYYAIRAWYYKDVLGDDAAFEVNNKLAKGLWNEQMDAKLATPSKAFTSFIYVSCSNRDRYTALLGFDWIRWDNANEYETAFAKLQKLIVEKGINPHNSSGNNFAAFPPHIPDGYWQATQIGEAPFPVASLLALATYNVNPDGPSHAWADEYLNGLPLNPYTNDQAKFSPWHFRDCLELLSLGNGGGREWGAYEQGPSAGGYELQWLLAAVWWLPAAETATGGKYKLLDNDYYRTRWIGLHAIDDLVVEKTAFHPSAAGAIEVLSRLTSKTDYGGYYTAITDRSPKYTSPYHLLELQCLAGPEAPAKQVSGEFFDRVGSRLYYKKDMSQPDSTLRFYWHYRNIDNHREVGNDRTAGYAIGKVGLVSGHANRCYPVSALANGIGYNKKSPTTGEIIISGNSGWWANSLQSTVYASNDRYAMPAEIIANPAYLKGTQDAMVKGANGVYKLTRDWTPQSGMQKAVTHYTFDPVQQVVTLTDEIKADTNDKALGWFFSPNLVPPSVDQSGFSFGDGLNSITVKVEPQNGLQLTPKVWDDEHPFDYGDYQLALEWHKVPNGGSLQRIANVVGYMVTQPSPDDTYKVKTTITLQ